MKISFRRFANERVELDNNEFDACEFENCTLIYGGHGPVGLTNCSFTGVKWESVGPAQNTLAFMTKLYHGAGDGGRQLIEATIENIRKGNHPGGGN